MQQALTLRQVTVRGDDHTSLTLRVIILNEGRRESGLLPLSKSVIRWMWRQGGGLRIGASEQRELLESHQQLW